MNNILKIRKEIENLHLNLLQFILQRKDLVDQVWAHKQQHQIDLVDPERENQLIHQFDHLPELQNNENLKLFYHNVVKSIIAENKAYMKRLSSK